MTLRPEYSLGHSEFNDFLFASVGQEKNGMPLTVLSALTRLGFDPWGEAARLSDLPNEIAARALATTIAMVPEGDWKATDATAIAARLVDLLPRRSVEVARSVRGMGSGARKLKLPAKAWLVCIFLVAAGLFLIWHLQADHAREPASSGISSMRQ